MATTQPCPGVCELRAIYTADEQTIENVYHFAKSNLQRWTQLELDSLKDVFNTWHIASVVPLLPIGITLAEIVLTDLTDLQGLRNVITGLSNATGTHNSPIMPLSVTKAMELFTGSRGKGVNGHLYWPAFAEDQITGDQVVSGNMDSITLALETLLSTVAETLTGVSWCVLSRYADHARRAVGIAKPIAAIESPNSDVSVQKNRLPFHKRHKKRNTVPA